MKRRHTIETQNQKLRLTSSHEREEQKSSSLGLQRVLGNRVSTTTRHAVGNPEQEPIGEFVFQMIGQKSSLEEVSRIRIYS
jgi:hypothetical protein